MGSHGTPPSTDASATPRSYARDGRSGREEDTRRAAWVIGRRARSLDLANLVWLLPLALAAAYLVVFVVQLPHNVVSLTWNSDYASGYTIAGNARRRRARRATRCWARPASGCRCGSAC